MLTRQQTICIGGRTVALPCFFPSVSSVKTNLRPVDYVELLSASGCSLYLISAHDMAASCSDHQGRIDSALKQSRANGTTILMDSGNYEGFWKGDSDWQVDRFHAVCAVFDHDLGFCYDNQQPPVTADAIVSDVVNSVLRDQQHSRGTIVPIIHGALELLPVAIRQVAEQLRPIMLAVPERALGDGIVTRARSVRRIRQTLDATGVYYPLHLLGTGNPISIAVYAMAGADSFDGLEWCQTVVDHNTALLSHFQHWDFVRDQTEWGNNNILPYIQSVLMHNLAFYDKFMRYLHNCLVAGTINQAIDSYLQKDQLALIHNAIDNEGGH